MDRICQLLGIEYPIIQGAMANVSRYQLVGAVSEAGGLGVIASGGMSAEELRRQIHEVKKMTQKPFAVNLMLQMKNIEELVEVIIEEGVPVVTTGAGTPKNFLPALQQANVKVLPVIPNVKIAKKMEALGVDAIIAEGQEAGGHIGQVSTLPLVRQVIRSVDIPVVAAGGIFDGAGLLAMEALGASGVQMGSLFLSSQESPIKEGFRNLILQADETTTVVTGRRSGHPVRVLPNKMTEKYIRLEYEGASDEELMKLTEGSMQRAIYEDDVEEGSLMCGQSIGLITESQSVNVLIQQLMKEYRAARLRLFQK
ncbi:nitronate monooxygenase family protein [Facklamia sp. 7083-14-GEN3]|uniref:NAD(P)H-dependent flavin oxidoreductase n=1 Tax=Facklamia sp. 7083-14-GEN3 TaxID=2973478 RepID=UPI00215B93E9|nr:nitronate monooxygenase family protein [Facklamia sp. 7083-14-GEN3]MCR8968419.1 nitronate monooxygenase family protein [Facklamia sp. 7083-14-GEN3]